MMKKIQEILALIIVFFATMGTVGGIFLYNKIYIKKKGAIMIKAARGSKWVPEKIVVSKGESVKFWIMNTDKVEHGFYIKDIELGPMALKAGKDTLIKVSFPEEGEYVFNCAIVCAEDKIHDKMKGLIVVK